MKRTTVTPNYAAAPAYLPGPPTENEKYRYYSRQRRASFVWLFFGQCAIIYAFVQVARRSAWTLPMLAFLLLMLPPLFVNLWLRLRRHRGTLDEHLEKVAEWRFGGRRPSVDVFLPVCGESPDVIANTWRRVADLDYSGPLNVHVLDDAGLPWVRDLAYEFGFSYIVRPNRGELKKAGNLIHAFGVTGNDFILVFDADFAPRPDFLYETLPYFDDPVVGVVQTSQFFDTRHPQINFIAQCSGALQNLFFQWIQPARDTYEAAICAGTNVVYRRMAVVDAGGFARVPIGEDVHSGVKLWASGWHTRYLRLNLAKGVAPASFEAIVNQQVRWCRSSMLLMVNRNFTLAPFRLAQRMSFWGAFIYYLQSAAVLVTLPLPTLVMVWGYPGQVRLWYYLPIVPGLISAAFVLPRLSRGWTPAIFRVTFVYSVCHFLAVTHALQGVVQAWVPTGVAKKKADLPRQARTVARVWLLGIQTLLWAGLFRAFSERGVDWVVFIPVMLLAAWQLVLVVPMLLETKDQDQISEASLVGQASGGQATLKSDPEAYA